MTQGGGEPPQRVLTSPVRAHNRGNCDTDPRIGERGPEGLEGPRPNAGVGVEDEHGVGRRRLDAHVDGRRVAEILVELDEPSTDAMTPHECGRVVA